MSTPDAPSTSPAAGGAGPTAGPWRVEICHSGDDCWCRIIVGPGDGDDMGNCVVPAGAIKAVDAHRVAAAVNAHDDLDAALRGLLDHYLALANSGDAGSWDPEAEPQVIAARAALDGCRRG